MDICFASGLCAKALKNLKGAGFTVIDPVPADAVLPHTDIYLHITPQMKIFAAANASGALSEYSDIIGCKVADEYPGNALYNCVCVGRNLLCNTKTVLPAILDEYRQNGYNIIHVNQGYTKCSVIPLEDSLITDDPGIADAAKRAGIACLLVSKGSVKLDGYPYGLIGGAAGVYGRRVFWNGDPETHADWREIDTFLTRRNFSSEALCEGALRDIGSILFLIRG